MSDYSDKLRDPRWQKKRLEIFQRDNFRCVLCGRDDLQLQIHHVVYTQREPWDYPDYLYQTLCEECHQDRTELLSKIIAAIRIAVKDIPNRRTEIVASKLFGEAMESIGLSNC